MFFVKIPSIYCPDIPHISNDDTGCNEENCQLHQYLCFLTVSFVAGTTGDGNTTNTTSAQGIIYVFIFMYSLGMVWGN